MRDCRSLHGRHSLFGAHGSFINAAFVGNSGFDPLGLATGDTLVPLRNADLKVRHATPGRAHFESSCAQAEWRRVPFVPGSTAALPCSLPSDGLFRS